MAVVKGTRQLKMIVVPYRPGAVWSLRVGILLLLVLGAASSYFYGHYRGVLENGEARIQRDQLAEAIEVINTQNTDLKQQVVNLEQMNQVDKQALVSVQSTILSLRENISQLQEDVLFYKQIMSPENTETGLFIGQLDLIQTGQPGHLQYRFEFKQQGSNENLISGYANINVLGTQDEQEISIPLRSLSDTEQSLDIRLQFRYFQNIEGELVLPDGFTPERVQIVAVAEGSEPKTVQKSFSWVVRN